jgi:glycosyltransferase involved in cell wall biosynthesis
MSCERQIEGTGSHGAPEVSVLIPTYNQERFIDGAIASALDQDYPSLEVIVLDDASTDGTGRTALAWTRDSRFRYVRNERNLGRVANYRRGLNEMANGAWVVMLDGDDFFTDPAFISHARAAIARHADRPIVFAQAGHRMHYPDRRRPDRDNLPPIKGGECVLSGGDYLRFFYETGFFTHLGALYDRCAAMRIGFYTADISSSDMESFFRLALEGEVLLLNTIAGCWVQHGENASLNLHLDELEANVRIFGQSAALAVGRGLVTRREISRPLRRYEAFALIYLFRTAIGKTARGPLALLKLLHIAFRVNPGLLTEWRFLFGCLWCAGRLTASAVKRFPVVRFFGRTLRRLSRKRGTGLRRQERGIP